MRSPVGSSRRTVIQAGRFSEGTTHPSPTSVSASLMRVPIPKKKARRIPKDEAGSYWSDPKLEAVVGEGLVRFRHAVRVFLLLDRRAGAVVAIGEL